MPADQDAGVGSLVSRSLLTARPRPRPPRARRRDRRRACACRQSTAVAQISFSGRIANIVLTHRSDEDPDSLIRIECAISESVEVDEIDLPPAETTNSLAAKIEEGQDRAD
jgi:hypothetical protein